MGAAELNIAPLVVWASALTTLLNFGFVLWGLFSSPARKSVEAHGELKQRVEAVERDMLRLKDELTHMPDTESIHRLEIAMTRVEGHLSTFEAKLAPVAAIAERMQELMLEEARGAR